MKVEKMITLEIDVKVTGNFVKGYDKTFDEPGERNAIEDIEGIIIDIDKQIEGYEEYIEKELLEQYYDDDEGRRSSDMEWKMEKKR